MPFAIRGYFAAKSRVPILITENTEEARSPQDQAGLLLRDLRASSVFSATKIRFGLRNGARVKPYAAFRQTSL